MSRYVVAYINFFDNDLQQEVVEVYHPNNWKDIYRKTCFMSEYTDLDEMPDDYEEAKVCFFDGDQAFSIIEVD